MRQLTSFVALLLVVCTSTAKSAPADHEENTQKIAIANNYFAVNYHRQQTTSGKTVFSPFSLSTALAMLFRGAKGTTLDELRKGLGYEFAEIQDDSSVHEAYKELLAVLTSSNSQTKMSIANALLSEKTFSVRPDYKTFIQSNYGAEIREVDFAKFAKEVTKEINEWVKLHTNGKIEKLLDEPLSSATVLAILNAVHFKGKWNQKFDHSQTWSEPFYNKGLGAGAVDVDMMHQRATYRYFDDADETDTEVLEIPYEGKDFSMWILLTRGEKGGLEYVEEKLTPDIINRLNNSVRDFIVDLSLPKFSITYGGDASSILKNLGMPSMFQNANLEGISSSKNLKVSEVVHKAMIEVDEEGTEAAASTGIFITRYSSFSIGEKEHTTYIVNHPFLYFIVDNHCGTIVFMGRVDEIK